MAADEQRPDSLRAADADRNEVADHLRRAVDEGRLSMFEYDDRLKQAYSATTYGELEKVTADLPDYRQEKVVEQKRQKKRRDYVQEWLYWLGGAIIMNGIWLVTSLFDGDSGMKNYWPAIPLGIWAVVLVAGVLDLGTSKPAGDSRDRDRDRGRDRDRRWPDQAN